MAKVQVRVTSCPCNPNLVAEEYTLDTITGTATNENGNLSGHPFKEITPFMWRNGIDTVLVAVNPPGLSQTPDQAFKADAGKPRFDLLMDGCPDALLDVVKVLTWAVEVKGYTPHSWQEVPEAKRRYRAALQRHENAVARGELNDSESGLPHRAHIATNALFLAQLDYIKE